MRANAKKLAIVFVVLVASCYFLVKSQSNKSVALSASAKTLLEVKTLKVQKQNVQLFQDLPARVAAFNTSDVRPQVSGVIKEIKFEQGTIVAEGQELYQIDPSLYQADLDKANAAMKAAKNKKERYEVLLKIDAVSKQEYDDAKAAYLQAEGDVVKAKTSLKYSKVLAPISGYVGKSNITVGRLATANQAEVLTTITQLDPIYVDMVEPSKDAVKLGDVKDIPVNLIFDGVASNQVGVLQFAEVFADEATDSVRLRAKFSNEDQKLLPGMFVTARLQLNPIDAILVPQKITSRAPDGSLFLWVVDDKNTAKMRVIKAERISGANWIVDDGLNEGDAIIVEGFQKVADGVPVNPSPLEVGKEEKK